MSNDFLYKEYELNYEQLRFYDSRQESIFQYLFTLASSAAAAQFAIYQFTKTATQGFYLCSVFLAGMVFIASLLLYAGMLQNRLYFVFTARQLNAIRGYLLKNDAPEFKDNQLYTSTNFPALKLSSVHTFQLVGAALISSAFGCAGGVFIVAGHNSRTKYMLCDIIFHCAFAFGSRRWHFIFKNVWQ